MTEDRISGARGVERGKQAGGLGRMRSMRLVSIIASLVLALFVLPFDRHTADLEGAALAQLASSQDHLASHAPYQGQGETTEQGCAAYCALAACSSAAVGTSAASAVAVAMPVCGRILLPGGVVPTGQVPEPGWRPPIYS
ncbi:MAG: hypothetical protein Q8Q63_03950 [Phaeovulum sp.]|uniref:hypothetical protein n=1 Tax=Phaeovulum sp. TaxID=2934796 RepID=UPI0027300B4F|nr:hypothetical protein [Phaeovulum sp.]MDP2062359.1 hypothetical protein [Phaeovulum sp.]MDP3860720.1 hypothetical protein [Phaeovulum sp.]